VDPLASAIPGGRQHHGPGGVPMTGSDEIVDLQVSDGAEIAALIARVFAIEVQITWWLVPDDLATRARLLREQFTLLIRAALDSGGRAQGIRRDDRLVAASVWSIHRGGPVAEPPGYDAALRAITGSVYYARFRALDDTFREATSEAPHHHLELLAAEHRGEGMGTRLVKSYLGWADQQRDFPEVHLHACSSDAARRYARLGFHTDDPAEIPDSDQLFIYPMHRPQPAAGPSLPSADIHVLRL
jgi:GNAT superfamily N-acetyltransferase